MAAKQQGKRKAKAGKRKKLQKKYQQAKRDQKRLQGCKQKKLLSCPEHGVRANSASNTISSKVVRIRSPKLFASKMVRRVLKTYIEVKAKGLVKTLLMDVYNHVATQVETLSQTNRPSPISSRDVQRALKDAMAKELAAHAAEPISSECA
ncbi:hypothetical protein JD844_013330 [Phrynosoma platyrhinos]|uniref:Histone H2B n=1 Tax=Phrynosoma platyrhinos TaxID=52577 RepID=A0ABQ7TLX3_PHRPL|nr:hypothetical protein JD844_013330 [Phrynosoma platyrhinos]